MKDFLSNSKLINQIEKKYGYYFDSKKILFKEGDTAKQFYILREGRIKIFKTNKGEEITINIIKPDEIFGEMALLSNHKRTASAETLKKCFIISLDEKILFRLMETDKTFVMTLLKEITHRLRTLSYIVRDLSIGDEENIITTHIANFINFNSSEKETSLRIGIDQLLSYIRRESGIHEEKSMKILKKLQKKKLINFDKQYIYIIDTNLLLKAIPTYF
jgi:CRP/FNR family transcriptional regulator